MHSTSYMSLCFLLTSFPLFSTAKSSDRLLLPKPNGAFEVGMGTMEMIDKSRLQPFAADVQPRRFMISSFYPVKSHSPTTPVDYLPPTIAAFENTWQELTTGLDSPNGTFEKLAIHLASPSAETHVSPIVLFSPAEGTNRYLYSAIAQQIASTGYIVITIDAPRDVDIVQYPDSTTDLINTTVATTASPSNINLAVTTRAQDATFVLDQLSHPSITSKLLPNLTHNRLNTGKVAMFGHSLGGAATAAAMLTDPRIAGGLAMDGALFGPVIQQGLDRPFMFMAHTNHTRTNDNSTNDPYNSWYEIWSKLRGWKLDIQLANSQHYTFSDFPIVLETLGIVPNATVAGNLLVTDLDGARALQIVTTYVGAFLDMVLKCETSPLLEGPVDAFPEVTFER